MISLFFYLILFAIALPSGKFGIKLEILLIIPVVLYSILQIFFTRKLFNTSASIINNLFFTSVVALIAILILLLSISQGKLIFYQLLMIMFALIYLFGYLNCARIINLISSFRFPVAFLVCSSLITYQSFTAISSDGWDTLGGVSGSIIVRGSIGVFESNSLSISCSGLICLGLLSLYYTKQQSNLRNIYIRDCFCLYISIFFLALAALRTFSRTGIVAAILAFLLIAIPLGFIQIRLLVSTIKFSKIYLTLILFLSALFLIAQRFIPVLNINLLTILASRVSLSSLTYDKRFEIWQDIINSNSEYLLTGRGIFVFSDNFLLSQIFTNGLFFGVLIFVLTLIPFFGLLYYALLKQDYFPISIKFASYYLSFSAIIYAISSDFIGQSKTLPILYLTAALLNRLYLSKVSS